MRDALIRRDRQSRPTCRSLERRRDSGRLPLRSTEWDARLSRDRRIPCGRYAVRGQWPFSEENAELRHLAGNEIGRVPRSLLATDIRRQWCTGWSTRDSAHHTTFRRSPQFLCRHSDTQHRHRWLRYLSRLRPGGGAAYRVAGNVPVRPNSRLHRCVRQRRASASVPPSPQPSLTARASAGGSVQTFSAAYQTPSTAAFRRVRGPLRVGCSRSVRLGAGVRPQLDLRSISTAASRRPT